MDTIPLNLIFTKINIYGSREDDFQIFNIFLLYEYNSLTLGPEPLAQWS